MKKVLLVSLIMVLGFSCFSIGIKRTEEISEFDSDVMLENFYIEPVSSSADWNNVKISLLTVSKGDAIYSWFGHSGLLVEGYKGYDILYDYGRFAFSSSFFLNFIKGNLWFSCGSYYAWNDINCYIDEGRSLSVIELKLTPEQKEAIVSFLNINTSNKYNRYLYKYFTDNCATRIRDILNYATNGDFAKWAKSYDGYTYREQISKYLYRNTPLHWIMDFIQGPSSDEKSTLWNEMFLPENLEKAVLEYGKLTENQSYIVDFRATDKRPVTAAEPQSYTAESLYTGLILACLLLLFRLVWPKAFYIENSLIIGFLALAGSVLFYMFFSAHSFSWNNENILFINPLLWICFFLGFNTKKHCRVLSVLYGILTAFVTLMIIIKMVSPSLLEQANYPQLLAVFPVFIVNFLICLSEID